MPQRRFQGLRWHLGVATLLTVVLYLVVAPLLLRAGYAYDVLCSRGPIPVLLCFLAFFAISQLAWRMRSALGQQAAAKRLMELWGRSRAEIDSGRAADMLDELSAQVSSTDEYVAFRALENDQR